MFTGIIAAIGKIEAVQPKGGDLSLQVATQSLDLTDVALGDSIAINGVCLTVVKIDAAILSFDVSRESLERTSLGNIKTASEVNLEKALAVGERLGGHFVSGHVDGLGSVISMQASARSTQFRIEIPTGLERYIAEKGSICIDGVSLTVNKVGEQWFEVNIIPHTMQETIISRYQIGSNVNLEVDLIARYLERLLPNTDTGVTRDTLLKHGFIN
ncbi:riboflavin synthase subunit alpha [Methylophaga sp. 42_25_T18]|nr:riboflavin synthase subunit alpha [Methylophaga sp. 42_25_T18]OUR86178.1 riboflavin synthase subunit alpha [Methylophaga sp. 42_8_T64]